jgi:site-specific recombinase XerD
VRAPRAPKITPHSLRHHFVTTLLRRNVNAEAVRKLAGHAELSTTQRYAHLVADWPSPEFVDS